MAHSEAAPEQADLPKRYRNFIFVRLPVLRQYLEQELMMPNLPFPFDLKRAIDDWVRDGECIENTYITFVLP